MIYIASPFSHPEKSVEEARYHNVLDYTAHLIQQKIVAFSPIVHCYGMHLKHKLPGDARYWKRFNEEMLVHAHLLHVLKLDGWETSKGVQAEIQFAKYKKIPIIHIEGNGLWRESSRTG